MKRILIIPFISLIIISCDSTPQTEEQNGETTEINTEKAESDEAKAKDKRKSPRINKSYSSNGLKITFDYGSPRVRDRVVWGDLVPYDKVWRAGADEVSAITFSEDVVINQTPVKAGTYGMFIIPKKNDHWAFILNEEWSKEKHDVWGAYDYTKEKDVLRLNVTPHEKEMFDEELHYSYDTKNSQILFSWEYIELQIPVVPAEPI